jgi:hypothetical protein
MTIRFADQTKKWPTAKRDNDRFYKFITIQPPQNYSSI